MGTYYAISPVSEATLPLLESACLSDLEGDSRFPLLSEIREILGGLEGCSYKSSPVIVGRSWDAQITCRSASGGAEMNSRLTILELAPETEAQEFYFAEGCPELIFRILCGLSSLCGILVLFTDGMDAFPIRPNSDSEALRLKWLGQNSA